MCNEQPSPVKEMENDGGKESAVQQSDESQEIPIPKRELDWLIGEMGRIARHEAGHYPKESMKRTCVFQWTAAVAVAMGEQGLPRWVTRMLPPLYKELADSRRTAGIVSVCTCVCVALSPPLFFATHTRHTDRWTKARKIWKYFSRIRSSIRCITKNRPGTRLACVLM